MLPFEENLTSCSGNTRHWYFWRSIPGQRNNGNRLEPRWIEPKKRRLMHAAEDYLRGLEVVVPYHRFDMVEVILKRNRSLVTIPHIAGAFVSEIVSPQRN